MPFNRTAILGCGLIGGSFALGLKKRGLGGQIIGCDRDEVLEKAKARGAIDAGTSELSEAVATAELVYLAAPVVTILDLLPQVAKAAQQGALVTDAGSTKVRICRLAKEVLPGSLTFIGGHPMAGKEASGIENADPDLFVGSKWVLIRDDRRGSADAEKEFAELVEKLGAEPIFLDAETHDWAAALVSHLPQLLSTALASTTWDETDEDGLPLALAGPGFRDLTRLAASPYELWRDVCLTNGDNIARALERLEQRLAHIRTRLRSRELAEEFEKAQQTCAMLKRGERT
ncbi:MAG TPA: prephenate dehydrogenase/arogenate dehydrogenase family protein [Candidatus Xenobia bacterium]|nr:prephenate dehydrogenase/arogenate dehydrogenase family protein [Candidatus Xenobia bacterium]